MPQGNAKSRVAAAQRSTGSNAFTAASDNHQEDDDSWVSGSEDSDGYEDEAELLRESVATLKHRLDKSRASSAVRTSVKRKADLRAVYTGDSRTTKWRRAKKEIGKAESVKNCQTINSYFSKTEKPVEPHTVQSPDFNFTLNLPDLPEEISQDADEEIFLGVYGIIEEATEYSDNQFDPEEYSGEEEIPVQDDPDQYSRDECSADVEFQTSENKAASHSESENNQESGSRQAQPNSMPLVQLRSLLEEEEEEETDILEIIKKNLSDLQQLRATGAVMRSLMLLTAVAEYVKLHRVLEKHPNSKQPWLNASLQVAKQMGKGTYFARSLRFNTVYIQKHKKLPPYNRGKKSRHASLLDNEAVLHKVKIYLASQQIGEVKPRKLRKHIIEEILPMLSPTVDRKQLSSKIDISTVRRWLPKLRYIPHRSKQGLYVDGHERPDVVESRINFLRDIASYEKYMCIYDDKTLEPTLPTLEAGEREHILIVQDESIFHVNDQKREMWLAAGQQILRQKGNGRAVHVSDFLCEKSDTGRLSLSPEQLSDHEKLPEDRRLAVTDCRKTIYPGKNADKWWDMPQLLAQTEDAVNIFEYLHPGATGVFLFDCSSAHEAFAPDALNVNNMNVNPGGKQSKLRDTIIPLNNPPPKPGRPDTRGQKQTMVYPADHPDTDLAGKPKGLLDVLREREGVWDRLSAEFGKKKVIGNCKECKLSQKKKDALEWIAKAEQAGQEEEPPTDEDLALLESAEPASGNNWCCAKRVLSLQQDFVDEKPMLRTYLEARGHVCLFLPKFHCELNPIELYWGFAKYRYRDTNDGKFGTAKALVPLCLDLCSTVTMQRFFRKCWRYMDSYRKGLDFLQASIAVKKYKSHRCVPDSKEVKEALQLLVKK